MGGIFNKHQHHCYKIRRETHQFWAVISGKCSSPTVPLFRYQQMCMVCDVVIITQRDELKTKRNNKCFSFGLLEILVTQFHMSCVRCDFFEKLPQRWTDVYPKSNFFVLPCFIGSWFNSLFLDYRHFRYHFTSIFLIGLVPQQSRCFRFGS